MMNQHMERLDELATFLQAPAREFVDQAELRFGRKLLVVWGYRPLKVQMERYRQGREETTPGIWKVIDATKVVTNAMVGPHNVITRAGAASSVAFDVIPLNADGTADWNPSEAYWATLYELAWKIGFDPLGDRAGAFLKGDAGHFEEPGWKAKLGGLGLLLPA